jgi:hypothetical protein
MVLLVPGVPWTYVLLRRARVSILERIGVSAALSIASIPVALFLLNTRLGVPINGTTTVALVLCLALAGALIALWRTTSGFRVAKLTRADISGRFRTVVASVTWSGAARILVLGLIMGLAFYISMIPRLDYAYPIHTDEWTHFAEARTIVSEEAVPFYDVVTGEARSDTVVEGEKSTPHFEVGYHVLLAEVKFLTGLPWLTMFRFLPSFIFALAVIGAYVFGNRRGFGLEAALFACLVPTTVRFLGPAFVVPVALGLFLVPVFLFLVDHCWRARALPLLLLPLLSFLFIAHPPTALLASMIVVVYGLFQTARRASMRRVMRRRALTHVAVALAVVAVASLPALIYNHWLVGTAASAPGLPRYLLETPGGMIPRLGYFPYLLFVLGLVALARSRNRADRALLVITVLVAAYTFVYYQYGVGNAAIYARFVLYLSMLVLLIAGLATSRIRNWIAASLSPRWASGASLVAAGLVLVVLVLPSLGLGLQSRYEERYYRRIHETEYEDFVWMRENLCPEYERALMIPRFGRAFAAITGKYVYAPVQAAAGPVTEPKVAEATQVLQGDGPDATWLRERGLSVVYSLKALEDPELVAVRDRVYVLPPDEVCATDGQEESVQIVPR